MKGFIGIGFLLALLWSGNLSAYSYGPACQWIHMSGEIQWPEDSSPEYPVFFTVTYQIEGMKRPATLLTNFPVVKKDFRFFFSGFKERLPNTILVPPMFFFAKEIKFRYFAKTRDGRWKSPTYLSVFHPPRIPIIQKPANEDKEFLCHTGIALEPLQLEQG